MANRKTHWLRTTLLILAGCAVIGLILSAVLYARDHNRTYASATLSFSFDGAAEGLAPNGYAFDINDISDEEVITQALEDAGMSGQYEIEDIQANLSAQGIFPEDLIYQLTHYDSITDASSNSTLLLSNYNPTSFSVVLYNDFDPTISQGQLTALLQSIVSSYRAYFAQTYRMAAIDSIDLTAIEDYDYFQQIELLQFRLQQAAGYADSLTSMDATLALHGKGFSDMSLKFNNLISSDLSNLTAIMTMNTLSKDLERLENQYHFEIQELQNQVEIQTQRLENLDILITTYGKSGIIYLSTSDNLSKVDNQSSKVYDNLVDLRNQVSDGIASLNAKIATYENKLAELSGNETLTAEESGEALEDIAAALQEETSDAEAAETALSVEDTIISEATDEQKAMILEAGIQLLTQRANAAADELNELIQSYNEQEINDLTVSWYGIRYKAPSVFSGAFIKQAVKTAGPIMALGFMAALILIIRSRRKDQKRQKRHV